MDETRALLDKLMGINRNNDRKEDVVTDFRDDRVCKFYLRGVCPNEMFVNTKMDTGPCKNLHSDELRAKFERSGTDLHVYDAMIERDFNARIAEVERSIRKSHARLEEEKMMEANAECNAEVIAITAEIQVLLEELEVLISAGDIDKAYEVNERIDKLSADKQAVTLRLVENANVAQNRSLIDANKKLRVCDVCGSLLSILDADKRLADHFLGKQHTGFQVMRDALESIRASREERRQLGGGVGAPGGGDGGLSSSSSSAGIPARDDYRNTHNRDVRDSNFSRRDSNYNSNRDAGQWRRRDRSRDRSRSRSRSRDRRRNRDSSRDRDRDRDNRYRR